MPTLTTVESNYTAMRRKNIDSKTKSNAECRSESHEINMCVWNAKTRSFIRKTIDFMLIRTKKNKRWANWITGARSFVLWKRVYAGSKSGNCDVIECKAIHRISIEMISVCGAVDIISDLLFSFGNFRFQNDGVNIFRGIATKILIT